MSSRRSDLLRVWRDNRDQQSTWAVTLSQCHLLQKQLESSSDSAFLFHLDHVVLASKITYVFFIHIAYDSSNPAHQHQSQKRVYLIGLGGSVGLSLLSYPMWVVCFLSSKAWLLFKNLLFVEYPSFRDEGIQTILLLAYRLCDWFKFTSSYRFCLF